jgi:hypothetical protein
MFPGQSMVKAMDIVVDCPLCGERVPLPPVYVITKLVIESGGQYLTAEIGDVARKDHVCRILAGDADGPKMAMSQAEAKRAYGDGAKMSAAGKDTGSETVHRLRGN